MVVTVAFDDRKEKEIFYNHTHWLLVPVQLDFRIWLCPHIYGKKFVRSHFCKVRT